MNLVNIEHTELAGTSNTLFKSWAGATLLLTVLVAYGNPVFLRAQNPPTEYEVKAAYLYQFGKFVEWPEGTLARSDDEFVICTLGMDPFGSILDETISGRAVQSKKVIARRLTSISQAADCNILFVSSSEENHVAEIFKMVQGKGVLTVGEMKNFLSQGGMIRFQMEQNKVRFEINLSALGRANLKVSSQLLKVAKLTKE